LNLLNNRLLKTELVEWKKLIPFQPDNLKKTEPHKLQKLANSLCENGFSMNFYVWEKDGQIYIIDGHSRQEVLQLLESGAIFPKDPSGKEYQVTIPDKFPCSFLHLKNKAEAKKAVLIYNSKYKTIDSDILSEWVSDLSLDELKSQIEIPELKLDFDIPQDLENDSIDDAAKIQTNIKLGDLIEIGNHRLLCGDCSNEENIKILIKDNVCDLLTDPPYGIGIDGQKKSISANPKHNRKEHEFMGWDSKRPEKNTFDILIKNTKNQIIWGGNYFADYLPASRGWLYWSKGQDGLTMSDGELAWTSFDKPLRAITVNRAELQGSVHPTQKPVSVIAFSLKYFDDNHIILDSFLGSGTTMVACQTLDRICYGMELEPLYCQVIINRMRKNFPELEIKINGQIYAE
jgi:site-specific DNA-methyltransferase (adenine-specific)